MNYLAHLFFAENSQYSILGNLMGDFVKGRNLPFPEKEICDGITLHRAIDKFTDAHPVVQRSKHRISGKRRRFSGIMIDIFYDHFLATCWENYSSIDFYDQITCWYKNLNAETRISLPEQLTRTIHAMSRDDWLSHYKTIEGIASAINGISRRIRFRNQLAGGAEELVTHYDELQEDFHYFFPELIAHVHSLKDTLNYSQESLPM